MDVVALLGHKIKSTNPEHAVLWVAFSGGMDSTVLLHALWQARQQGLLTNELRAVHINHQLAKDAGIWEAHALAVAASLDIPCVVRRVNIIGDRNIEAQARAQRQQVFASIMHPDDLLLTAHHQRDQAETLLLQLMRGSGLAGLAAMPELTSFAAGRKLRPFLEVSQQELAAYAKAQQLSWVEDPSNQSSRFDRNFLRLEVLPLLQQRWPQAVANIGRSAQHCAGSLALEQRYSEQLMPWGEQLIVDELAVLPKPEQRLVLRSWLAGHGLPKPLPTAHLEQLLQQALHAQADSKLAINVGKALVIKRYQGKLYCLARGKLEQWGSSWPAVVWDGSEPLTLPNGLGQLTLEPMLGDGIAAAALAGRTLRVSQRQGGERCQPQGRSGAHPLKKLLQESYIPPWQRAALPLLYLDDDLVAVADLWVCEQFAAQPGEQGLRIVLRAPSPSGIGVRGESI